MRNQHLYLCLALAAFSMLPGCVSTGSKNMETVVTDMHQRVTLLDEGLEPSLAELNENAAALIQRVNENERQVRLLTSLVEENQHKLDKLIQMLSDLRATLYRHWGLTQAPLGAGRAGSSDSVVQIVPPERTASDDAGREGTGPQAPPVLPAAPKTDGDTADYTAAKRLYDREEYGEAGAAFAAFLKTYPKSGMGHKAQFWLGKCHLNQSEYSKAISAFETLRRDYPESSYMAFALHNQAVGHFRLGEDEKAVALMEEVVKSYPTSTAADHARRDLKQIRGR